MENYITFYNKLYKNINNIVINYNDNPYHLSSYIFHYLHENSRIDNKYSFYCWYHGIIYWENSNLDLIKFERRQYLEYGHMYFDTTFINKINTLYKVNFKKRQKIINELIYEFISSLKYGCSDVYYWSNRLFKIVSKIEKYITNDEYEYLLTMNNNELDMIAFMYAKCKYNDIRIKQKDLCRLYSIRKKYDDNYKVKKLINHFIHKIYSKSLKYYNSELELYMK